MNNYAIMIMGIKLPPTSKNDARYKYDEAPRGQAHPERRPRILLKYQTEVFTQITLITDVVIPGISFL
jgi:hypothetical protein